jgi:hypothetical protein
VPPLTRWFVKTALVYLIAALFGGALLASGWLVSLPAAVAVASPAQIHLFVVGWLTQLIFGIAYWMFPSHSRDLPRGRNDIAIAVYVLLNVGLILRAVAEPWQVVHPSAVLGGLLVASAIAQWLAGVGFVIHAWPRVRGR